MFENVNLTDKEKMKVAKVSGSLIGKLCFGAAVGLKATGIVIDKSTGITATGLRIAADGIETAGQIGAGFCYEKSDKLKDKAQEYDLSSVGEAETNKDMAQEITEEPIVEPCVA